MLSQAAMCVTVIDNMNRNGYTEEWEAPQMVSKEVMAVVMGSQKLLSHHHDSIILYFEAVFVFANMMSILCMS